MLHMSLPVGHGNLLIWDTGRTCQGWKGATGAGRSLKRQGGLNGVGQGRCCALRGRFSFGALHSVTRRLAECTCSMFADQHNQCCCQPSPCHARFENPGLLHQIRSKALS